MQLKAAKLINSLVFLLMVFEIIGAALTAFPASSDHTLNIHQKKPAAHVIAAFLMEKAEEEAEKTGEENGSDGIILVDFSRVALILSLQHTLVQVVSPVTSQYDLRPPVYTLNCVFLI